MSNPSDTVAELHSELTSALRAIENAEDTFNGCASAQKEPRHAHAPGSS
jgi:hypothetical protein